MSCSGICVLAPSPWLLPDTTTMLLASGGCCISMSSVDSVNPLYVLCVCMQTCMIVCQLGDYMYIYIYISPTTYCIGEPETTIDMCLCEKRVQRWYDINNMTMHDFVAYIYIWIAHSVLWLLASAKFLLISILMVSWVLSFPNVSMKIPTILS